METTWVTGRAAAGAARVAGVLVSFLGVGLAAGLHAWLPGGGSRQPTGDRAATVTLITGDRVHVQVRSAGETQAMVVPAPGRETISFARVSSTNASGQEDLSIVPADAQPLLVNGLLDPELFNVTGLVRQGLTTPDDSAASAAGGLPLIVTFEPARARIAPLLLTGVAGVQRGQELPSIGGVAVADGKGADGAFWKWLTGGGGPEQTAALAAGTASSPGLAAGVAKVWLDARAQPLLNQSGPQIGVPQARALGLTGAGVSVAVLDTGIKADHPDLAGRIGESRDFTNTRPDAGDDVGHGTHVAGIIGGTGAASGGQYQGVAPAATLLNGKVCILAGCPTSAIIAGMEWAAARARVINMSLGGGPTDGTDPMSQALDALTLQHGTLFIVSAGNTGRPMTVSSPASAREAVAIGSVTKQDTLSSFSSQGPRVGDFAIKPDLAAPGSLIVGARAAGTQVGDADPVDANYVRVSGTSMAAPHVVGAAALLLQQHPTWTNAQLRAALMSSAAPIQGATVFQQGAGRLDVGRAVTQSVFASGTASFGLIPWPHDRPATTQTVTYANHGSESVTLDLALLVTGEQGTPAPDGMFTVNSATVTVPPQGTADAQITLTPANRTVGTFSGRLIATSGTTTRVVTAVAAIQEQETFNLTLTAIGRAPSFVASGRVLNLETALSQSFLMIAGRETVTMRLPRGRYQVDAGISSNTPEPSLTLASEPEVAIDGDTSVVLDATRGRRVSVQVDADGTVIDGQSLVVTTEISGNRFATAGFLFTGVAVPYAVPTRPVTGRFYEFVYQPVLGVPVPGVPRLRLSPIYTLELPVKGRIPEQPAFVVHDRELARVRATYHAQGVMAGANRGDFAFTAQRQGAGRVTMQDPEPLPSQRIEYFTPGREFEWAHFAIINIPGASPLFSEREQVYNQRYRAGHYERAWNRAPLGPAFNTRGPFNAREGDTISIDMPLFSANEDEHFTQTFFNTPGVSGTTRLTRDGVTLGEFLTPCSGRFVAPDSPGRYTLTCTASRTTAFSVLGTRSEATWTFAAPGPTATPVPLPMLTVRATGSVFGMNDAPAGRLFPLVLRVDRLTEAPSGRITKLELDASFDDGASWKPVPVLRIPGDDRGLAILHHPRAVGFVSLRLRAADANGNRVTHTTLRSYALTVVR